MSKLYIKTMPIFVNVGSWNWCNRLMTNSLLYSWPLPGFCMMVNGKCLTRYQPWM